MTRLTNTSPCNFVEGKHTSLNFQVPLRPSATFFNFQDITNALLRIFSAVAALIFDLYTRSRLTTGPAGPPKRPEDPHGAETPPVDADRPQHHHPQPPAVPELTSSPPPRSKLSLRRRRLVPGLSHLHHSPESHHTRTPSLVLCLLMFCFHSRNIRTSRSLSPRSHVRKMASL